MQSHEGGEESNKQEKDETKGGHFFLFLMLMLVNHTLTEDLRVVGLIKADTLP